MMLATYVVAGVRAYLYARRAGADLAGSVATSLIWQWSAFMVEQIGHPTLCTRPRFCLAVVGR